MQTTRKPPKFFFDLESDIAEMNAIARAVDQCPEVNCDGELDTGYECVTCGYDAAPKKGELAA